MLDVTRQLTRATENVPKFIDPQTHKMLDWMVAGTYLAAAAFFARRHRGAAIAAALNGGAVLGATLMTDYDGDRRRPISFPVHGVIDAGQMAFAAAAPAMFGFQNRKEAILFQVQAASEAGVIAATDWEATAREEDVELPSRYRGVA